MNMADSITWIDRLRDRGFTDQLGFMIFAVGGFAGIISAKALGIETIWVAIGAVVAMLLYALAIGRQGIGRLRADQAGDNCYYLGLIYTLASLSYAITTFDPNDTATTVVQGFGIALATTIIGLILRVYFAQGRPDLENSEVEARLELTDAVARLKGELNTAVRDIHDFSERIQQILGEVHVSSVTTIESFTKASVDGMREVSEAASTSIRDEADNFALRSKKYTTTFDKLLVKVERHGAPLDDISVAQEQLRLSSESISAIASDSRAAVEAMREASNTAMISVDSTQASVASVANIVERLVHAVSSLQTLLSETNAAAESRITELRAAPIASADAAVSGLERAAQALEAHIRQLGSVHTGLHDSFSARTKQATELAEEQNRALESELKRSREVVEKVHSSLAEMTDRLATSLERAN